MNASELRQLLRLRFGEIMEPKGFKGTKEFYKKNILNEYRFRYGFASYGDIYEASVSIIILDYQVNKICEKITDVQLNPNTLSYNYAHYINQNSYSFQIRTHVDIDKWVKMVNEFMTSIGFQVFEEFNSYESLDKLYNSDVYDKYGFRFSEIERAYKGILFAKLVDNPEYNNLVLKYRNRISDMIEMEKEKFEKMVVFLSNSSYEDLIQTRPNR